MKFDFLYGGKDNEPRDNQPCVSSIRSARNNLSPPTPRTHGKPNDSFKSEDNLKVGVSFLTNAYKQFTNKTIMECIKDGFTKSFLRCQYPQAPESSINADVSTSEPGRNYFQATDGLCPVSFPSSYGKYATVQIGVICNYPMLQTMNLMIMVIPHCIFNVTQTGTSTMSQWIIFL